MVTGSEGDPGVCVERVIIDTNGSALFFTAPLLKPLAPGRSPAELPPNPNAHHIEDSHDLRMLGMKDPSISAEIPQPDTVCDISG